MKWHLQLKSSISYATQLKFSKFIISTSHLHIRNDYHNGTVLQNQIVTNIEHVISHIFDGAARNIQLYGTKDVHFLWKPHHPASLLEAISGKETKVLRWIKEKKSSILISSAKTNCKFRRDIKFTVIYLWHIFMLTAFFENNMIHSFNQKKKIQSFTHAQAHRRVMLHIVQIKQNTLSKQHLLG